MGCGVSVLTAVHSSWASRERASLEGDPRFCAVGVEPQASVGGQLHGLVGEGEVPDDRLVQALDAGPVQAHVVRRPSAAELFTTNGQFADEVGQILVVRVASASVRRIATASRPARPVEVEGRGVGVEGLPHRGPHAGVEPARRQERVQHGKMKQAMFGVVIVGLTAVRRRRGRADCRRARPTGRWGHRPGPWSSRREAAVRPAGRSASVRARPQPVRSCRFALAP